MDEREACRRNIRLPKSMDNYVSEAVHREGLSNRSEYSACSWNAMQSSTSTDLSSMPDNCSATGKPR
jgi:hypothetical protein